MKKVLSLVLMLFLFAACTTNTPPEEPVILNYEATSESSQTESAPAGNIETINLNNVELSGSIHINQLGYRPNDMKRAVLPQNVNAFRIVRFSDGVVVYEGTASEPMYCPASEETVRIADFSTVTASGEYVIYTSGERSYPFIIDENVYTDVRRALLDFFHYQKCGVDLDAGVWSHPACHITEAYILNTGGEETGETKDVSGGWHHAGDYGRYIVPSAMTVAQLLWAYELSPNPDVDVPEIVWFKIEWMLKMQDEATGGVYHKVTCKRFPALNVMPERETGLLVLSPISATSTANFAATMAMASRFYPEQSDMLLAAAERAWEWCIANPNAPSFRNPRGVLTGEYGDNNSNDERLWAACELFIATGEERYHDYIKTADLSVGLGWQRMGTYGLVAYLLGEGDNADDELYQNMKGLLLSEASIIYQKYQADPHGVSLDTDYYWGSNMLVSNNAVTLLFASILDADAKEDYANAALDHMHYLLGKNALSQSYVTGFGSKAAQNPHHRPSVAMGQAVPGMVVGGPNKVTRGDPTLDTNRSGFPPAKCYIDHKDSYASNETAIYWNSPMYLAAALLGF